MKTKFSRVSARLAAIGAACLSVAASAPAPANGGDADEEDDRRGRFCSATTRNLYESCGHEVADDFFKRRALCLNITRADKRKACLEETASQRSEGQQQCQEQRQARGRLCDAPGEARYDPPFEPANFETDFINAARPNAYFPLRPGSRWKYVGGDETIAVEVLNKTKLIDGVSCVVVHDRVEQNGQPVEDTDDWYALRRDGTVFYCGESVRNFERFEGDRPAEAELVDIDGSWKTGRNGDLPGTQFLAVPVVGAVYRQEFSPANAEDAAMVLANRYGHGRNAALDQYVPAALARYLCSAHNCVVTGEFSPLEPGAFQRKYYAPGIGLFLEVSPQTGGTVRLVECNVDPRCAGLAALPAH